MWETDLSVTVSKGFLLMVATWAAAVGLVVLAWLLHEGLIGHLGLIVGGMAASLTVMRDNQRTRRMLRRPDEVVKPLR